jgi:hypothetical protein
MSLTRGPTQEHIDATNAISDLAFGGCHWRADGSIEDRADISNAGVCDRGIRLVDPDGGCIRIDSECDLQSRSRSSSGFFQADRQRGQLQ